MAFSCIVIILLTIRLVRRCCDDTGIHWFKLSYDNMKEEDKQKSMTQKLSKIFDVITFCYILQNVLTVLAGVFNI